MRTARGGTLLSDGFRTPPVPGLREHVLSLKDLGDAIRLRNRVLRQIELADARPRAQSGG